MTIFPKFGKRLTCFLLVALCLLTTVIPVNAVLQPRAIAAEYVYTCLVRNKATVKSPVIGQMEDGAMVTVLDETEDFYKIDCYDMVGYVRKTQIRQADGTYYIRCVPGSDDTVKSPRTTLSSALQVRSSILELAKKQLGKPYIYGSMGTYGFDCSGLTSYIYAKHDISLHRCADEQLQDGLIVSKDGLQVGDLLFFREAGCPWLASHVGIYAGNGMMIHAGRGGIEYANLNASYYEDYFLCARRTVNVGIATVDAVPAAGVPNIARRAANGLRTAP